MIKNVLADNSPLSFPKEATTNKPPHAPTAPKNMTPNASRNTAPGEREARRGFLFKSAPQLGQNSGLSCKDAPQFGQVNGAGCGNGAGDMTAQFRTHEKRPELQKFWPFGEGRI